jgi:hypothetical protein
MMDAREDAKKLGPLSLLPRRCVESWDFERGTSSARCSRTTDRLLYEATWDPRVRRKRIPYVI